MLIFPCLLTLAFGLFSGACTKSTPKANHDLQDAPTGLDRPDLLQRSFAQPLTLEQILARTQFTAERPPWTDDYWRIMHKGLAFRYLDKTFRPATLDQSPNFARIGSFMSTLKLGSEQFFAAASWQKTMNLSPAEKFDLLNYASKDNQNFSQDKSELFGQALSDLMQAEEDLIALNTPGAPKFAPDKLETQGVYKKVAALDYAQIMQSKFNRFGNVFPLTTESWLHWLSKYSRPDTLINGTAKNLADDWYWEGHCHGWTTAAVYGEKPLFSVLAEIDGRSMMFTESDLRGLTTKAWANQGSQQPSSSRFFVGKRCSQPLAKIPMNKENLKIADGVLCQADETRQQCLEQSEKRHWYGSESGKIIPMLDKPIFAAQFVRYGMDSASLPSTLKEVVPPAAQKSLIIYLDAPFGKPLDATSYSSSYLYNQFDEALSLWFQPAVVINYLSNQDLHAKIKELLAAQDRTQLSKDVFEFLVLTNTGCKAINPLSFHSALIQYLNDNGAGRPFIIDRSFDNMVWNHPVFSYQSKILSVQDLTPAQDKFFSSRTPGTAKIVDIETKAKIMLGLEPPKISFFKTENDVRIDEGDATFEEATYRYSLEIDARGFAIGGEWHLEHLEKVVLGQQAPDFIWGFNDVKGLPLASAALYHGDKNIGLFQTHLLKRLVACANDENLEVLTDSYEGVSFPYKKCLLTP